MAEERKSGIPGFAEKTASDSAVEGDSVTTRESFKPFYNRGRYIGRNEAYGGTISDTDRLFYSTREPVGVWWIKGVAYDIWDNWFRVKNPADLDDVSLDADVQEVLIQLRAKMQLPRETVFERRYGTSILLCSYTGFGSETSWETPLFTLDSNGLPPKSLNGSQKLLQITPYPWTSVSVFELDENTASIRCGLPKFYTISTGAGGGDSTNPTGMEKALTIKVHWTRVIHDAPRLDEHTYEGVQAIDSIFDDLVGGRNARWGAYESYYRHGTGFPVIKTNATASQNQAWVDAGGLNDFLNVRGYFICNTDEDFSFVGAQAAVLNPNTYFDMYFTFIAAATGVAKDSIAGVSAGRVTGNESNERKYFKAITLQQNQKEPMLRELIDRIIQTGQVNHDGAFVIEWIDPFEVNPQDKASIEFLQARTQALRTYMTVNEVRELNGLEPHEDGDVLMLLPGQMAGEGSEPAPNQEETTSTTTPAEGTENNDGQSFFERVINRFLNR